jgi:hypothetical protein
MFLPIGVRIRQEILENILNNPATERLSHQELFDLLNSNDCLHQGVQLKEWRCFSTGTLRRQLDKLNWTFGKAGFDQNSGFPEFLKKFNQKNAEVAPFMGYSENFSYFTKKVDEIFYQHFDQCLEKQLLKVLKAFAFQKMLAHDQANYSIRNHSLHVHDGTSGDVYELHSSFIRYPKHSNIPCIENEGQGLPFVGKEGGTFKYLEPNLNEYFSGLQMDPEDDNVKPINKVGKFGSKILRWNYNSSFETPCDEDMDLDTDPRAATIPKTFKPFNLWPTAPPDSIMPSTVRDILWENRRAGIHKNWRDTRNSTHVRGEKGKMD